MANPPSSPSFDWKMYRYTPSLALAVLFLTLFSIVTTAHAYVYLRHRKTSIDYAIIGGLCESPVSPSLAAAPHPANTADSKQARSPDLQLALVRTTTTKLGRLLSSRAHFSSSARSSSQQPST